MDSTPLPLSLPPDHLGLYIHVPFCVRKCRYCDFSSQAIGGNPALPDQYLDALAIEARRRREASPRPLHSIFIGGGTPTTLTGAQLRRLWHEIIAPFPRTPQAEISIEANPGTFSEEVLAALAEIPLTRVSIGVQSMHPDELSLLGRIHTPAEVADAVAAVRAIGIPRINLDLIYALPGQTPARWAETLRQALTLRPDHLSLYALMLEEGTPLTAQVEAGQLTLPGEEEEEAMADATDALLAAAGFIQYEVSNAAPAGLYSRHNLGYWLGRDYLGLGPAATSTFGAVRWRNTADVAAYIARVQAQETAVAYAERLSGAERLLERVMLGLRLRDGFTLAEAENDCGCTLDALARAAIDALQREGLLEFDRGQLRLTSTGFPLANTVVSRLMVGVN